MYRNVLFKTIRNCIIYNTKNIEVNIDIVAFEHKKNSITTANFMVRPSGLEPPTPTMSR